MKIQKKFAHTICISGAGCALADYLYSNVSFDSPAFRKYRSITPGDGGLSPGHLVFVEDIEKFAGKPYKDVLREITGTVSPDSVNIGGPSIVSLIHAAQMLPEERFRVRFFGISGNDETSEHLRAMLEYLPLDISAFIPGGRKGTPFTHVLSDPAYSRGQGERTFINHIGAAWDVRPEILTDDFFNSDIVCFGGTALVPCLHDNLSAILQKAKKNNCLTLVNTVFDFRNENLNPGKPWPLLEKEEDYTLLDLLIMDTEEAKRISGQNSTENAAGYFMRCKCPAFIITSGPEELLVFSSGGIFGEEGLFRMPVSHKARELSLTLSPNSGDTTGCGDNFAGGVIASLACQLGDSQTGPFDLREAVSWGVVAGGFCRTYLGGTYFEKIPGEKRKKIYELYSTYVKQPG